MRALAGIALLAALVFAGAALPAAAEPKPPVDPDLAKSDATLLQDEDKAIVELQRRLRAQVSYRNGLLIVIDKSGTASGVTVVPATMMWGIDCGDSGLAVTFGAGGGDTDNGIVLQLTGASITDDKCLHIAPAIGEVVLALAKGN